MREGLRFWKFDQVGELLDQATGWLDDVDEIVASAQERDAKGELDADRTLSQLAKQGPELIKRVTAAREIYQKLRRVAEKAAPIRAASSR